LMALQSFYNTQYKLKGNPFPGQATYSEDAESIYVPEMFGAQHNEFLRKFVLAPLENGQPLIGAVWSIVQGDPKARGFGKSTLMGEEAKLLNADFGLSTLTRLGVSDKDARANPVLAGYVSFNAKAQGGIANIDAAAFHLVRFMLRSSPANMPPMHTRLRELAAARLVSQGKAIEGQETDDLVEAVRARFRALAVTVDIRNLLEQFLFHLASPHSATLDKFLGEDVGTWHHDRNGLKYLQLFVAFAELAGIEHFSFFIDQVEDFTSMAGQAKIEKNVKILRDALIESEPFKSKASFIFQLHPGAWSRLRDAWSQEDLRSLDWNNALTAPFVVVLKGLETFESARVLAERFLNHPSFALPGRTNTIAPFTDGSLRKVWEATQPKPRDFLRRLHGLLAVGKDEKRTVIDEQFVVPKLEAIDKEILEEDGDLDDDRLA
jgi:hypothetical protein